MTGSTKFRTKNGFQRTRKDHASEKAEDYAEAIAEIEQVKGRCRCADLARLFRVTHVTVVKTIARLKSDGIVTAEPYAPVQLTAKGRRLARAAKERHDLVLEFLLALGVERETAEIDAEGIEHHVSPNTIDCFQRYLDNAGSRRGA